MGLIPVVSFADYFHLVHFASKVSIDSTRMASLVDRSTPISQSFGFIGQEYFVLPALQVEPCQFEQWVIFRTVVFVAQYVMVLIALLLQLVDSFVNG
ncbi:hypothetical protein PSH64_29800 [Pseudomonas sp. FP1742]|nr:MULTISPECIES: hypothetical protein [Pseudomonas]WLG50835.1 hypothetical protein PSH64_29800 [Pseudomonas sp. FP1742]